MNRYGLHTYKGVAVAMCTLLACAPDGGDVTHTHAPPPLTPLSPEVRQGQYLADVDSDGDGFSPEDGDCDDTNPFISPSAAEACDGVDNNCDAEVDNAPWVDADDDGFYSLGSCLEWSQDCDDDNPNVWSSCGNCVDLDSDGYFVGCDGYETLDEDCDDTRANVNDGAVEVCDGLDNDCDFSIDEGQTTPAVVLHSNDTLDCLLDGSPFNTVALWDEPALRIEDNAHDVTIRNCTLSNRVGAVELGNASDVLIEHTLFVPRAVNCGASSVGVISGDFEDTLTLRDVRVIADDGSVGSLWQYTAVDVDAGPNSTLLIEDSLFEAAAGLRAFTSSDVIIRRSSFVGNPTALVEWNNNRSDAEPLSGMFVLAVSLAVEDSSFATYADPCAEFDVGTADISGNRFSGCDTAMDTTGTTTGFAYLNDFGTQLVAGPIQLYDSRAGNTHNLGNYWGGSCAGATFSPGPFFTSNSISDAHPYGVAIAGSAPAIRDGVTIALPPCPATGDADNDGVGVGDCDDGDPNVWTACSTCADMDSDGYWSGCDAYVTVSGPDCNDGIASCATNCFAEDLDLDGATFVPACGVGDDCDDSNASVYGGASELDDDLDNDCDGLIDEDFSDADGDGLTTIDGDCDDADPRVVSSCETCRDDDGDGVFAGCDAYYPEGQVDCDDNDPTRWTYCEPCFDADEDGYPVDCDTYIDGPDCDDQDDQIHPGATEVCDSIDNDCDGSVDDGLSVDADGDGRLSTSSCSAGAGDCNDSDPDNWSACSTCVDSDSDGLYEGCDRYVVRAGPDCDDTTSDPNNKGLDADHDGAFGGCAAVATPNLRDCDDATSTRSPLNRELPCDGIDNDCDGFVDENATSACVPLTSTASLETAELGGIVRRDEETGEIAAIALLGTAPPAVSLSAASHLSVLQSFVSTHATALRLTASPQLGNATITTTRRDVFAPANGRGAADLPHEVPQVATTRVRQYYQGHEIIGGEIRVTSSVDDDDMRRVRNIDGRFFDPGRLGDELGDLSISDHTTFAEVLDFAVSWCSTYWESAITQADVLDSELSPGEKQVDVLGRREVYLFKCRPLVVAINPASCQVTAGEMSCDDIVYADLTLKDLDFNKGRNVFTTVNAGGPASNQWFIDPPDALHVFPQQYYQNVSNVPVDVARVGTNCVYRGTYAASDPFFGGLDSEFPFPRTNDDGGRELYRIATGQSSCDGENNAWTKAETASFYNQMAHEQIATAADDVVESSVLGLWKKRDPVGCSHESRGDCQKLRVKVRYDYLWQYNCEGPFGFGDGQIGVYNPITEDICLNPRHPGYSFWHTALHEYGHYVADQWGVSVDIQNFLSCEDKTAAEGIADAIALSLEHYRRNAHTYPPLSAKNLYFNGPGPAGERCRAGQTPQCRTPSGQEGPLNLSQVNCDGDLMYYRGMALSQVLWSLLTNHYCPLDGGCTQGQVVRIMQTPITVLRPPLDPNGIPITIAGMPPETTMPIIAREALTNAMIDAGNRFSVQELLFNMRNLLFNNYRTRMTSADWQRIQDVFALHGVDPIP